MSLENRLIVIAYPDGEYIKGFEEDLMKRLGSDIRIQVITETDYLMEFFSFRRTIDALIIAQELIGNYLQENDIKNLMILDSRQIPPLEDEGADNRLLKFVEHEDILRFIDKCFSDLDDEDEEYDILNEEEGGTELKVTAVYSPAGGAGKSLTALALGKKLKMLGEKVLVIGTDSMQSFGVFLENHEYAEEALAALLKEPTEETYWTVLKNINQDHVPCLLPFEKPLAGLGIGAEEWIRLIDILREKKDFAHIILDLGSEFSESSRKLMACSDLCILITESNVDATRKLEKIHRNMDLLPETEFVTLVNQYHSDGIVLTPDNIFGSFRAYGSAAEAMEDPVFYRLALKVAGEEEQQRA